VPGFTPFECDCGSLESAAREPRIPIVFDAESNEYHIIGEGTHTIIRHCPFCGGYPPPSRRPHLSGRLTLDESIRLAHLTRNLKTLADVIAAFGAPDEENHHRTFRYHKLSELAFVEVSVSADERVQLSFVSKPVHPGGTVQNAG